jgi:hypothetical protein
LIKTSPLARERQQPIGIYTDAHASDFVGIVTMTKRIASCCCGQLQAKVSTDPIRVSVCHCLACQRRTGSVFGAQARFSREAVQISGQGTRFLRTGDEGTEITFTFCPQCGSTVFYEMAGREEFIAIPVGAFADPGFPAPSFSVYEDRMHSWVQMPKDIEHMA